MGTWGWSKSCIIPSTCSRVSKERIRSILIDLPGHGTLVDKPLTLDSCVKTVKDVLDKECTDSSKIVYIGASLGAYIGFHILSKLQHKFTSSILLDCGQNVGPDCSFKARFGLWFLRKLSSSMSNKTLTSAMMNQSTKTADYHIHECSFGSGMFFQQGAAQCDCLHSVAPADLIPSLNIPILYFDGSEDHRDSENKW